VPQEIANDAASAPELRRRLDELERRFRSFLSTAADWCWEADARGRLTWLSRESILPPETLLGRTRWEVAGVDPEADPAWRAHAEDLRAGRAFRGFRYSLRRPEGGPLHCSVNGDPLFDAAGGLVGWRGTGRDVTAEVETAAEIAESRALLSAQVVLLGRLAAEDPLPERGLDAALEAIGASAAEALGSRYASVWLIDRSGAEIRCAAAWDRGSGEATSRPPIARRLGLRLLDRLRAESVVAVEDTELDPLVDDLREDFLHPLRLGALLHAGVWRNGALAGCLVVSHEGGARRWTAGERSLAGSLAGHVSRTLEAADRLEAERTLRESVAELERKRTELEASERRFRDLIEGSLQGVLIVQHRRFVYVNQALCRMSGYAAEELLAGDRWLIVAPEDLPRFKRSLAEGPAGRADFRGLSKDGAQLWLECLIRPIEWGDEPAWQVVVMDATDRRRAEEQLRQAQRMEAVGQLTGGVAHDFNNLLAIILGNLDLVREADLLPPAEARMLESAVAAAARGARLTGSLLAFARRQQLNPEPCDVNALVERATELFERTLGETIRVELRLAPGLPAILVDPAQLDAALLNLVVNARDAMPGGGLIAIETAAAVLDPGTGADAGESAAGEYVVLSVADAGTGMAAEVRERAFEPFFTTKDVDKGAGLGLSMVYGFVKQSGGRIRVRSEPGAGSVFELCFPRAAGAHSAQAAASATAEAAGLRVLMVEDDPDVRETVLAMLASIGCQARAETDGAGALRALAGAEPFDVLLTDVVLPGELRGGEIAEQARRLRPDIKVLFMTGFAPQATLTSADLADGAPLGKPFRRPELAQALARLRRL